MNEPNQEIERMKERIALLEAQLSALFAELGSNKCRQITDSITMGRAMRRAEDRVAEMTPAEKRVMIEQWLKARKTQP